MIEKKDIEAFILAGGKSSRMGTEKGLVYWKGKRFIEHILDAVKQGIDKVSIISNTGNYEFLGIRTMEDLEKGKGPLGGIHTGLKATSRKYGLFVSCDIPFIKPELLKHLLKVGGDSDIVVPVHNGKIEPLCGIYAKHACQLIGGLVKHNKLGVTAALRYFDVKYVDITQEDFYTPKLLSNINSQLELKRLETELHEH